MHRPGEHYGTENIRAEKELKVLKPNIEGWEADFGKETMTKGKAYLNMTWSGDAVWAIEEAGKVGVELGYEVPKKVKERGKTYFIGENELFLKEKRKKCRKNLVISNKSITFALAFET